MSDASLPHIEDLTIARLVGPLSHSRGRAYAENGNVGDLEWDPATQTLRGEVRGTAPAPYRVTVKLLGANTGRITVRTAMCTCPVGINCKHAAAVLHASTARRRAADAANVSAEAAADAAIPVAEAGWRGLVAALDRTAEVDAPLPKQLALQFELRRRVPRATLRSGSRHDERARDAASADRLAIRPVTGGVRGGWIKAALNWQNVGYQGGAGGFDPAQARWFAQLNTLKGSPLGGLAEYGADWITLDTFDSSLLWALLAEAPGLGISLVGTNIPEVALAGTAEIGFDAGMREGELQLRPSVVIDGRSFDALLVRLIGAHGVYVYDAAAGRLLLARLSAPLTRAQRALIERPAAVRVQGDDVAEFLGEHFATLARSVRVVSTDDTFTPPDLPRPTLVLGARFEAGHVLRLGWEWDIGVRRRLPFDAPDTLFRDAAADRAATLDVADALAEDPAGMPLLQPDGTLRQTARLQGIAAAEFTARVLPALEALEGVAVEITGEKPDYREVVEAPVLAVSAMESESNDWFDLGVTVSVEGRVIPFGPLFTALSKGATKLLLVDHSYLSLQQAVFAPLRELIEEAGGLEEWETGLRISRYQTALWSEFEDLADESEAAVSWRATVDGLRNIDSVPPPPVPTGFAGELRPYQREGFSWLAFLYEQKLGGILADDMGLGKTAQALALVAHAAAKAPGATPFLVVAPTSVVSNWKREAARFTPGLRVADVTTTERKQSKSLAAVAAGADIVLTSYAILRLDAEAFADLEWSGLILDEAQFAKNPASKVHDAARGIRAPFRLAVTGTPIENNLTELWALLRIVAPGLFASSREFAEKYRRPIEINHDTERLDRLRRRVRPFMLRRTKEAVAPELPPKQEQVLEITLDPRHRRIYDTHLQRERQKILGLVDDLDRNRFIVFRSLTLLRMLSLDAALIDPEGYANVPSAKLDGLLEQLDDVVGEGHQALVFSQFTSFLQRAAARLDAAGIPYSYLDGSTRNREKVIDGFRRGDGKVFLISLKAGGFGLNLTEADYVFLLDPWWNPASEAQAVDRAHRIGQTKQVMVYRMVATNTIEEKVMALKEKKAALVSAVIDDDAFFSESLSADDIRALLES